MTNTTYALILTFDAVGADDQEGTPHLFRLNDPETDNGIAVFPVCGFDAFSATRMIGVITALSRTNDTCTRCKELTAIPTI